MQKSFNECTSCGYCFLHILVVHHSGITLLGVNPLILALITTATMWWHGSLSTFGELQLLPPKCEPIHVIFVKKHLLCFRCPRDTLHAHLSSYSAMSIWYTQKSVLANISSLNLMHVESVPQSNSTLSPSSH
jgi:hypothetical protein